jgi:hypothetical protein
MATPQLIAAVDGAIDTYEDLVGEYASRTRHMLDLHGYVEALSRLVQNPDLQSGFKTLRDAGQLAVSFEAVVVEFADEFDPQIVSAAQWRLDNADSLL